MAEKEKKPVCEITIEAADIPDHALVQLPVVLRECQKIMGCHGYNHAYLGRGNIGKWALSLVRGVEVAAADGVPEGVHDPAEDRVAHHSDPVAGG